MRKRPTVGRAVEPFAFSIELSQFDPALVDAAGRALAEELLRIRVARYLKPDVPTKEGMTAALRHDGGTGLWVRGLDFNPGPFLDPVGQRRMRFDVFGLRYVSPAPV